MGPPRFELESMAPKATRMTKLPYGLEWVRGTGTD